MLISMQWQPRTVEDLACYWFANHSRINKAASSMKRDEGLLRRQILPMFGSKLLDDVKVRDVEFWLGRMRTEQRLAHKTCNEALCVLKKMFNDAYRWEFIEKNVLSRVKRLKVEETECEVWSREEVKKFLKFFHAHDVKPVHLWPMVVSMYTGLRRGELMGLTWDCVDFETGLITCRQSFCNVSKTLKHTKSGKIRYIPISKNLRDILGELRKITGHLGFVVPRTSADTLCKKLKRISAFLGNSKIRFHDLRHSFASLLMAAGGNIYDVKNIMGHSTVKQTERYVHMSPEHLSGKTEILGF